MACADCANLAGKNVAGSLRRGTECLSDAITRLDAEGNSDKCRCAFASRLKREQLNRNTKTSNAFFEILGSCRFWEYIDTSELHFRRSQDKSKFGEFLLPFSSSIFPHAAQRLDGNVRNYY